MTASLLEQDRAQRYATLLPMALLRRSPVTVVGVGAIGRQVALQLAVMGVSPLTLLDPEVVETVNLGAQGFRECDRGRPKAAATAETIAELNASVVVQVHQRRFQKSRDAADVLFCCVDSIETRRLIFEAVKPRLCFFVDGRMSAESLRILTVCDSAGLEHYPRTCFSEREAHAGACTARTTFYAASIAAGWMVAHYARWLRGFPVPPDLLLNLLADELSLLPVSASHDAAPARRGGTDE